MYSSIIMFLEIEGWGKLLIKFIDKIVKVKHDHLIWTYLCESGSVAARGIQAVAVAVNISS